MLNTPADIEAVALLDEPVRRALYEWIVDAARPVGRDEAAAAVDVSRALAAFHLDRLVRGGLLDTEYRRLSGRTGPGAGRPAKLYRRGPREVTISLPERRYEVAARLLAAAIERLGGEVPPEPLRSSARQMGSEFGASARRRAGPHARRGRLRRALLETLKERGYEPRTLPSGEVRLGNCPFDALVDDHRDLVCGMNLALASGLLEGLGDTGVEACLDPQPGLCCVAFRSAESGSPEPTPSAAQG